MDEKPGGKDQGFINSNDDYLSGGDFLFGFLEKNRMKDVVAESCHHYKPAVIYHKDEPIVFEHKLKLGHKYNKAAYSYLKRKQSGYFECSNCGIVLNKMENVRIDKIVEYLNMGGDDDKKLAKWFQGITIGEILRFGPEERVNGITTGKGYVPVKKHC